MKLIISQFLLGICFLSRYFDPIFDINKHHHQMRTTLSFSRRRGGAVESDITELEI